MYAKLRVARASLALKSARPPSDGRAAAAEMKAQLATANCAAAALQLSA
jgi:hypothetical protein